MTSDVVNQIVWIKIWLPEEKMALAAMHKRGTLWHRWMGHLSGRYIKQLAGLADGVPATRVLENMTSCSICAEAKMKKLPFDNNIIHLQI